MSYTKQRVFGSLTLIGFVAFCSCNNADSPGGIDSDSSGSINQDTSECSGNSNQCLGDIIQLCTNGLWIDHTECAALGQY